MAEGGIVGPGQTVRPHQDRPITTGATRYLSTGKPRLTLTLTLNQVCPPPERVRAAAAAPRCPANCKLYFDGCNNCRCMADGAMACTRMWCATNTAPPHCKEEAAPALVGTGIV